MTHAAAGEMAGFPTAFAPIGMARRSR